MTSKSYSFPKLHGTIITLNTRRAATHDTSHTPSTMKRS